MGGNQSTSAVRRQAPDVQQFIRDRESYERYKAWNEHQVQQLDQQYQFVRKQFYDAHPDEEAAPVEDDESVVEPETPNPRRFPSQKRPQGNPERFQTMQRPQQSRHALPPPSKMTRRPASPAESTFEHGERSQFGQY